MDNIKLALARLKEARAKLKEAAEALRLKGNQKHRGIVAKRIEDWLEDNENVMG